MIALVLAAAVAASQPRLSQEDLAQAIDQQPAVIAYKQGITYDESACSLAKEALNIAGTLQDAVDNQHLLIMEPAIVKRTGVNQWYALTPEEIRFVTSRMHDWQTEAETQKIDCGV